MRISPARCLLLLFAVICLSMLSGCALLQIPGQIIGGTFSLIGKLLGIVNNVPKPPPWVFI